MARFGRVTAVSTLTLVAAAGAATPAGSTTTERTIGGTAVFTAVPAPGRGSSADPQAGSSLPTWSGSFSSGTTTYRYTMVGTNPAAGSATTSVPSDLVPLNLSFSNGNLSAAPLAASVATSPLFTPTKFRSGKTQLMDAMRRAEFWTTVSASAPGYHVLLSDPTTAPTVTLSVPSADGVYVAGGHGPGVGHGSGAKNPPRRATPYAYVDYDWFLSQIQALAASGAYSPATLPIFLSGDVFLYQNGTRSDCCVYGFHGVVSSPQGQQTFAYGNYLSEGLVGKGPSAVGDIFSLSHELSEWDDDPYVDNLVPEWKQPGTGICFSDLLEGADAVEGLSDPAYLLTTKKGTVTWHPSDIAGISWFDQAVPSGGYRGLYSYDGKLTTYATYC